jgi:2-haloacid dehalogenase
MNTEKLNESVDQMKQFLRDSLDAYPYTIATAAKINKNCKIPIGILSNHSEEWFAAIADKFKFHDTFLDKDLIVVSQAVALAKPDQKIFDLMFQRLKAVSPDIQPPEVLFIDDKTNNVDAAIKYGFHGFEFDASERTEADLVAHLAEFGVKL